MHWTSAWLLRGQFDQAAGWFLASVSNDPEPFPIHNELHFTRRSEALLPKLVVFYADLCKRHPQRALAGQQLAHYLIKQEIKSKPSPNRAGPPAVSSASSNPSLPRPLRPPPRQTF